MENIDVTKKEKGKKTNWIPTIVSIVIGLLIAIGTTWYTIYSTKEERLRAESERYAKVKENLVSIIEEHIVNKDSLDLKSFERLIINRSNVEKLTTRISIFELLTQAEYNINNSKHLGFDKKKEYSNLLSSLYIQLVSDTTIRINNGKYPTEISQIIKAFSETNEKDGRLALSTLINQYETEIAKTKKETVYRESIVELLLESPTRLILLFLVYFLSMFFYWYYITRKKRKRRMEREWLKEKVMRMKQRLEDEELSEEEKGDMQRRIEDIYWRLSKI